MRYLLTLLFNPILALSLMGQYDIPYTQHMFNKYYYNAAYAGLDFSLNANLVYRTQWQGIEGNPQSIYVGAHMPMYIWKGAVGGQLQRHSAGALSMNHLDFSYNYVLDLGGSLLSMGGRAGISILQMGGSELRTPEGVYGTVIDHRDPLLPINESTGMGFRWDVGVYHYLNAFQWGVSVKYAPPAGSYFNEFVLESNLQGNLTLHYEVPVSEEIILKTNLLVLSDFQEVQSHISSIVDYNGNIFGGIGMRGYRSSSIDAVSFIFGINWGQNYMISYSYDYLLSEIRNTADSSHEITFNYNLNRPIATGQPPKIIYNPRFL